MDRVPYPSDLNDKEWEILQARLPVKKDPRGRPRKQDLRELLNGIFYLLRTGCSWRMLPHDLPPWETVYSQFRSWKRQGAWEEVHCTLREFVRIGMGREPHPSALIIDSQSVKTTEKGGLAGTIRGRKSKAGRGISSRTRKDSSSR
jgi:putative transposase